VFNGKLNYDIVSLLLRTWSHFPNHFRVQPVEGTIGSQFVATDAGKAHMFGVETGLRYYF